MFGPCSGVDKFSLILFAKVVVTAGRKILLKSNPEPLLIFRGTDGEKIMPDGFRRVLFLVCHFLNFGGMAKSMMHSCAINFATVSKAWCCRANYLKLDGSRRS
jgi:hypothetical protein